jgi:hypothetical protein
MDDLDAHARALIEANLYLTLGTADAEGRPWVSPVYFATADHTEFYWVSAHDAVHSRNIAQRPQVSMVIFDSQVPTRMTDSARGCDGDQLGTQSEAWCLFVTEAGGAGWPIGTRAGDRPCGPRLEG